MTNTIKRLRDHSSAQCYVRIYENGETDFISYTTRVISIRIRNGRRYVECTGTYSPTTRRQIGWFLREYAPDLTYYDIKRIACEGEKEI